jgi:hypothetical protein
MQEIGGGTSFIECEQQGTGRIQALLGSVIPSCNQGFHMVSISRSPSMYGMQAVLDYRD